MATSFCRAVARVSRRLATFAQAMSSTSVDRPEQHQHGAADVPDDLVEQGHDVDRERAIPLVLVADPRRNRADVRIRLLHRHPVLETGHQVVVLVAAAVDRIGAERQRQEQIHLPDARDRRHDLGVQQELGSEHAGDRELVLVGAVADARRR